MRSVWIALFTVSCATSGTDDEEEGNLRVGRNETLPTVSFAQSGQKNFELGEKAYADEDFLRAQRYFDFVKRNFPYSQYAAPSEVRIGDCLFGRELYIEAIDSFQNFARRHPTHPKVPYARYRSGLAYYEQIPSDWFLLPPPEEKDQAAVRDAERALADYVNRYPDDENNKHAREVLADARKRLMAHERYAADFYRGLDKDRAYVGRLEVIRDKFADVGLDDELLLEIAEVYARLGEVKKLSGAVEEMAAKFPDSELLAEARSLLPKKNPAKKGE